MEVQREAIVERLLYSLVKAVELNIELKAIDEVMDYSSPPQEALDSALNSTSNLQIRLINTITLI